MKRYGVSIPIAGYVYKEVVADSEEEALDIALSEGFEDDDIVELDSYATLVEGNICYTNYTKADVEEIWE